MKLFFSSLSIVSSVNSTTDSQGVFMDLRRIKTLIERHPYRRENGERGLFTTPGSVGRKSRVYLPPILMGLGESHIPFPPIPNPIHPYPNPNPIHPSQSHIP